MARHEERRNRKEKLFSAAPSPALEAEPLEERSSFRPGDFSTTPKGDPHPNELLIVGSGKPLRGEGKKCPLDSVPHCCTPWFSCGYNDGSCHPGSRTSWFVVLGTPQAFPASCHPPRAGSSARHEEQLTAVAVRELHFPSSAPRPPPPACPTTPLCAVGVFLCGLAWNCPLV